MTTVLLASTLFRTRNNTAMVQEQLRQKGSTVNTDQARAVSHAFSDKVWELHTWIGYFVAIFLLTGLGLALEDFAFFRSIRGGIKQIHSFTQYAIYGFVFIHLVGVIIAESDRYPGIVSSMINGKKRL